MTKMSGRLMVAFWAAVAGFLGLYAYGLIMGAFSPLELGGFTVAAVLLGTLFGIHSYRVRRELSDDHAPGHDEAMHELHEIKERRGF